MSVYEVTAQFQTPLFLTEIIRTVKSLNEVHLLQAAETANNFKITKIVTRDDPIDCHQFINDVDKERHEHSRVAYGKPGR